MEPIERWMAGYLKAWNSNDPDEIRALFDDDATYSPTPFSEPWRGREAIVAGWLDRKDDPGTFEFRYDVLCSTDDMAVVRGSTEYVDPYPTYSNIWLVRFAPDGRCSEFIEWWMEKKTS